ncbi:phage coat protein [Chimaeribacter californicus]|uniref:Phage coat protein n=2 Tax=Yersiniaceae TaxID=1903411 RepID=A0A2N5EDV9_9GAMM|nr:MULTISPECIES: major capsid protein [Yersiniaceae]MBS0967695.1 phage coat protein [Nissabacter archeti]PLR40718.1 phage coat protein [Chimaeribacter californicus]
MFVFSRSVGERTGNLEVNQAQFAELQMARNEGAQAAADFLGRVRGIREDAGRLDAVNAVDDIRRLYRAFDTTVLAQFEPNTQFTLLNDLMPLSRSVRIEQSRYDYARTGGRGWAHTSMSGQIGAALDAKSYTFDGTMVPVHDSGFKFTWRDPIFNSPSALQSQADAQRGSVEDVQRQYVDYMFNGFRDSEGNYVQFDGLTWKGLKNDERVAQATLTFNFATSTDPVALRTNAIALRDVVRVTNSQYAPQTWYVSAEIMSNLERYFDVNATRTVLEELLKLSGIAAIKEDAQLSGNEILIVPLTAGVIAPIVGQAIGTVADPRQYYNSDYVWRTWGAMGLMVKQDINNKFSVIHAS